MLGNVFPGSLFQFLLQWFFSYNWLRYIVLCTVKKLYMGMYKWLHIFCQCMISRTFYGHDLHVNLLLKHEISIIIFLYIMILLKKRGKNMKPELMSTRKVIFCALKREGISWLALYILFSTSFLFLHVTCNIAGCKFVRDSYYFFGKPK